MLPEVLASCDHFNKTVSSVLLFIDYKLFIFGSSGMKISYKCKNIIMLDLISEKASLCVDTYFFVEALETCVLGTSLEGQATALFCLSEGLVIFLHFQ